MADLDRASVQLRCSAIGGSLLVLSSLIVAAIVLSTEAVHAQGSLGVGSAEQAIRPEGPFASILFWIQQQQQSFYLSMTDSLKAMRKDGSHFGVLAGLSFAYGIFHAAGPGHGKAVISSYMIANEIAARRGIVLAFASAFLQAISAIILIGVLVLFLRGAGIRQGDLTGWLETASYGCVAVLGGWLLYSKLAGRGHSHHREDGGHEHDHLHAPDPSRLAGRLDLRQAWSAVVAVGLRPCSGAIIVLTFAFLNGLYAAGVASAFAMALGTGITVAALAAMAVWAKDMAVALGRAGDRAGQVRFWIEIGGAILVLALGTLLFAASLA